MKNSREGISELAATAEAELMINAASGERAIDVPDAPYESTKSKFLQFLKFACFSLGAGVIQLGTCTMMNLWFGWSYWLSYIIALVLSVVYNFTINRRFTFKSANNIPIAMMKVVGYYIVFTPISALWGAALTDGLFLGIPIMTGFGWNMFIVLIPTMIINMVTEFIFCRLVVFRNSMNSRLSGQKDEIA